MYVHTYEFILSSQDIRSISIILTHYLTGRTPQEWPEYQASFEGVTHYCVSNAERVSWKGFRIVSVTSHQWFTTRGLYLNHILTDLIRALQTTPTVLSCSNQGDHSHTLSLVHEVNRKKPHLQNGWSQGTPSSPHTQTVLYMCVSHSGVCWSMYVYTHTHIL